MLGLSRFCFTEADENIYAYLLWRRMSMSRTVTGRARMAFGTREVLMRTPFITVLRNENRFLLTSPIIPELFAEGSGPAQSIERLSNALKVVLSEYERREQKIVLPPESEAAANTIHHAGMAADRARRPFVEVRSESDNRYLMTSPVFPELFVEGKGINQSVVRLIHALKVVLNHYVEREQAILMP